MTNTSRWQNTGNPTYTIQHFTTNSCLETLLVSGLKICSKCSCSLMSDRLTVSSCLFYNRNINHHLPLLASSSRGPVSLLDSTTSSVTGPRGGRGCQFCTCQPSISAKGLNQAHSSSLFIMAAFCPSVL